MKHVELPSGNKVLNLLPITATKPTEATASDMTSLSGAMVIDRDGKCPKCSKPMGFAFSGSEQCYYCATCRVSLPLPIVD